MMSDRDLENAWDDGFTYATRWSGRAMPVNPYRKARLKAEKEAREQEWVHDENCQRFEGRPCVCALYDHNYPSRNEKQ